MFRIIKMTSNIIKANIMVALMYPASFYTSSLSSILWIGLSMISITVLTYQSPELGGWNKHQLFAVQGVYSIILGTMYFMFGENFKKLIRLINKGDLDLLLTKPVDSQFLVSVGENKIHQLSRVLGGIILLTYALSALHVNVGIRDIIQFLFFMLLSCIIIYSICFLLVTLTIWLTNLFNIDELFTHLTGLSRYPLEVFRYLNRYLFYLVLPLVIITSVPTQIILKKPDLWLMIAAVLVAGILFFCSRMFWFFALKFYTSASS